MIRRLTPRGNARELFELHEAAGIRLRVLPNIWPF
jgi:hypothetical protein